MTQLSGFKISRTSLTRRRGPLTALPEQGDADRLSRFSNTLKDLGEDRSAYVGEIGKLWGEAQDRFLTIGRYLVRAKQLLPHGSFEAMIADELPFGKHVAWQLRTVAAAVDSGRIKEDELPQSYNTAYKLAKLDDGVLSQARSQNLLRIDVTRDEISRFLRQIHKNDKSPRNPPDQLEHERDELLKRLKALSLEQREAKRRLAEIERELSVDAGRHGQESSSTERTAEGAGRVHKRNAAG